MTPHERLRARRERLEVDEEATIMRGSNAEVDGLFGDLINACEFYVTHHGADERIARGTAASFEMARRYLHEGDDRGALLYGAMGMLYLAIIAGVPLDAPPPTLTRVD